MGNRNIYCTMVLLAIIVSSCARIPPKDDSLVSCLVQQRLEKAVYWSSYDEQIEQAVQCLLESELTPESAVQIALLQNPRIQVAFEEIGIAYADLIEAGLLSNPIFDAVIRFPSKSGFKNNTEFTIAQNFIDIFLIPLRTRVAAAEFEKVKLEVVNTILELSFEVEKTYYMFVAAQKKKKLFENIIELAQIANQIALSQNQVANITKLDLQKRNAIYLEKLADLAETEVEVIHLREELNKLLGFSGEQICWHVPDELPPILDLEPNLDCLEFIAFNGRLDIQIARWELERIQRMFPTVDWWAHTDLEIGVSTAREPDPVSPWTTGPSIAGRIPIFNYGQAEKRRLCAKYNQAQAELASITNEAFAEVRTAKDVLLLYRQYADLYTNSVIPEQDRLVASTEELYNIMAAGIYDLLDSKHNQLTASLNYQNALKEYWLAKVALDKSLSGKLHLYSYYQNLCCDGVTP